MTARQVEALLNAAKRAGLWPARVRIVGDEVILEPAKDEEREKGVLWK